jgi:hypothetical protein
VTLSFNLAPNSTIGAAVSAVEKATADLHMPPSIATSFQGNAQAFQSSLSSTPILILAALVRDLPHPRRAVREHDPSAHHHFDSALGRSAPC